MRVKKSHSSLTTYHPVTKGSFVKRLSDENSDQIRFLIPLREGYQER